MKKTKILPPSLTTEKRKLRLNMERLSNLTLGQVNGGSEGSGHGPTFTANPALCAVI